MIRRPPRSTLFPTRRSSDLVALPVEVDEHQRALGDALAVPLDLPRRPAAEERGERVEAADLVGERLGEDRKSTRLNSSHANISYAVFCLKQTTSRSQCPP